MIGAPAATTRSLTERVRAHAFGLGFDLVGFTSLGPAATAAAFDTWVEHGFAGEMTYLPRWADKRRDSRLPFPGVTSAVVVAMSYGGRSPSGPIARYARGDDYHDVMLDKLGALHALVDDAAGRAVRGKAYVDTGPLLERDLARRAGLGWFGKNTNLIHPTLGSFFFLGALLLDLDLAPDTPFESDHCGSCRRCLDACPTQAFAEPRVLDARRCISYLTIEARGEIPDDLRADLGTLIYGCDICQDVCPWNVKFAGPVTEPALAPRPELENPDLRALLALTDSEFRARFRRSAIMRAKRRGMARNVAVALGNRGDPADVPALARALRSDPEPLVRTHAAWALGRIGGREARTALELARGEEHDGDVLRSVARALAGGAIENARVSAAK